VFRHARWFLLIAIAGAAAFVLTVLATRVPLSEAMLRDRIVKTLSEAFDAEVELKGVTHNLWPLQAELDDLVIRKRGEQNRPAMIAIDRVTVHAGIRELLKRRVERVTLDGLAITISPKPLPDATTASAAAAKTPAPPAVEPRAAAEAAAADEQPGMMTQMGREVVVKEVFADNALLTILRREENKPARVWELHQLHLRDVGVASTMAFDSVLTNAVPPGQIETQGTFGPWNREDPAATPLDGTFTFENADLSVFKGIAGILSSKGSYEGTLERIDVNGNTETPDFSLNLAGHPVPLSTTYHAVVDGTNGNTTLEQIDAKLQNTAIVAKGGVYEVKNAKGRVVRLRVEMPNGQMADLMRLTVGTPKPPMIGTLRMGADLEIPPGDRDVVEKLRLDGAFLLARGRFTDPGVQQKINELSHRASAKNLQEPRAMAASDFSGWFRLRNGSLRLNDLTFDTRGAVVAIDGTYALRDGTLDFNGDLYMDAKVSQTVSGWKSFLLKIVDPLFREGKKTVVPLKIHGTRENPKFGLDFKRVF
jgi:hypothetical protein